MGATLDFAIRHHEDVDHIKTWASRMVERMCCFCPDSTTTLSTVVLSFLASVPCPDFDRLN